MPYSYTFLDRPYISGLFAFVSFAAFFRILLWLYGILKRLPHNDLFKLF